MITLYQFAASPFCDKIRRVLHYKEVPFAIHEWPLAEVPAIRDKSPIGKLPIVDIDGAVIPDSTSIALAIERLHPLPRLVPTTSRERAQVLTLEDWADESLYFYEMTLRFGEQDFAANVGKLIAGAPQEMIDAMAPMLRQNFDHITSTQGIGRKSATELADDVDRLLGAVEDLQGDTGFVVGKALTLADIAITVQAECICDSTVGLQVLQARPSLAAYFKRVDELTAADRV